MMQQQQQQYLHEESDVTRKLKKVQQLRRLLEGDGGDLRGAALRVTQERQAANAAAAKARNVALLQSITDEASNTSQHVAADAQFVTFTTAYTALVQTALPLWLAQVAPLQQQSHSQGTSNSSSSPYKRAALPGSLWWSGPPSQKRPAPAHNSVAAFQYTIPPRKHTWPPQQQQCVTATSPAKADIAVAASQEQEQQPQQQQHLQRQQQQQCALPANNQQQQQQQQQQQRQESVPDAFMESLQDITSQLALLQQALHSHQHQHQHHQQHSMSQPHSHQASGVSLTAQQQARSANSGAAASIAAAAVPGAAGAAAAAAAGSRSALSAGSSIDSSPAVMLPQHSAAKPSAAKPSATAQAAHSSRDAAAGGLLAQRSSTQSKAAAAAAAGPPGLHQQPTGGGSAGSATPPALAVPAQAAGAASDMPQQQQQPAGGAEEEQEVVEDAAGQEDEAIQPGSSVDGAMSYVVGRFTVHQQSVPVSRTGSSSSSPIQKGTPDLCGAAGAPAVATLLSPRPSKSPPPAQSEHTPHGVVSAGNSAAGADEAAVAAAAVDSGAGNGDSAAAEVTAAAAASAARSRPQSPQSDTNSQQQQQQEQQEQQEPGQESYVSAAPEPHTSVYAVDAVAIIKQPSAGAHKNGSKGTGGLIAGGVASPQSPPPPPPLPLPLAPLRQHSTTGEGQLSSPAQRQGKPPLPPAPVSLTAANAAAAVGQQKQQRHEEVAQGGGVDGRDDMMATLGSWGASSPSRRSSAGSGPAATDADAVAIDAAQQQQQQQQPEVSPRPGTHRHLSDSKAQNASAASPTASLHLHQQLVFSPLRFGAAARRQSEDPSADATGGSAGGSAVNPPAASAAGGGGDAEVATAGTASNAALPPPQQALGSLATALSGDAQQLIFSPLRLRSTSLSAGQHVAGSTHSAGAAADLGSGTAPASFDTISTPSSASGSMQGVWQQVLGDVRAGGAFSAAAARTQHDQPTQQQQHQVQQHQGVRGSLAARSSCSGASSVGELAESVAGERSSGSRSFNHRTSYVEHAASQQYQQQASAAADAGTNELALQQQQQGGARRSSYGQQQGQQQLAESRRTSTAANAADVPTSATTASTSVRPAPLSPGAISQATQAATNSQQTPPPGGMWEQAVFSPLRSGSAVAAAAAAAAAAAGSPVASTGTSVQQAEGLSQRHELVFSPLRLGGAGGGGAAAAAAASGAVGGGGGGSAASGSVYRSLGITTPSPNASMQLSPHHLRQQQQQQGQAQEQGNASPSRVPPLGVNLAAASPAANAASRAAGNSPSPQGLSGSTPFVLLPGSMGAAGAVAAGGGQQQQQRQQQPLSISSLAVGLGPSSLMTPGAAAAGSGSGVGGAAAGGARGQSYVRSTSQHEASGIISNREAIGIRQYGGASDPHNSTMAPAVGPLHSHMGSVHMGLLLSPSTRLSLGGASASAAGSEDGGASSSSGRPSLSPADAGVVNEQQQQQQQQQRRLSLGSRAAGGTSVGASGAAGGGAMSAAATTGGLGAGARPAVMASWSSLSSNASGAGRVPRLSLPPTLHVPDVPVPGSNSQRQSASVAGGPTNVEVGADGEDAPASVGGKQAGSTTSSPLPPPPAALLQHVRESQQLERQQQEEHLQQEQHDQQQQKARQNVVQMARQLDARTAENEPQPLLPRGARAQQQHDRHYGVVSMGDHPSGAPVRPRQGIGSCRLSSAGSTNTARPAAAAAALADRLVSKVLSTGLTEFSFEDDDDEGGGTDEGAASEGDAGASCSSGSEFDLP